jgi:hypothetical protein
VAQGEEILALEKWHMSIPVEKFLYNRREAAVSLGVSIRSVDYIVAHNPFTFLRCSPDSNA